MQSYELRSKRVKKNIWGKLTRFVLIILILFSSWLRAAKEGGPAVDRSRVYRLNYLTSEQAREYLQQLHIGRRVDALSDKILIVTSDQPGDLIRTSSVLKIMDSKDPPVIRRWKPAAEGPDPGLPTKEYVLSLLNLPQINFGTLLDPPPGGIAEPIILDQHEDALVLIGTKEITNRVDKIVREWTAQRQKELAVPGPSAEPNKPPAAVLPDTVQIKTIAPEEIVPAEPNVPAPAAVSEPNKPAPTDKQLMEDLAEVMAEQPLMETAETAEPAKPETAEEAPVSAAEPGSDEEFFNAELLKALTAAQEKAEHLQEAIEAEKHALEEKAEQAVSEEKPALPAAVTEPAEPQEEKTEDQMLLEIIEALRRKSEEFPEETVPRQPEQKAAEAASEAAREVLRQEPVSDLTRLEQQLARQEKQIAELKALLTARAEIPEPDKKIIHTISEPEIPEGEKELELMITLPEKVEITSLLELVGKQLGLNYMYDPAQIRGDVTLKIHDGKIKVKDTYALLESVLRFRGFIMTRRGNLVTIVPASQIKQADPIIRGPNEPIEPGDVIVSSVFNLENVTPAAAQKMLTDMSLGTGFVTVTETNTLIVTDYAYRMDRIEKVIAMVDIAGEPKEFKYRQLRYMGAADMVTKLKALTARMEGVTVSGTADTALAAAPAPVTIRRDSRGRPIPTRTPTPAPAPGAPAGAIAEQETVFLDVDERTNRIMMIGYPDQIKMINELIDTLDVPKYYLRYVREYFIQNVEAAEIITALNELGLARVSVSGGTSAAGTAAPARAVPVRPGQPPQPPAAAAPAPAAATAGEDQPYISVRLNTNSLLVNATKEQHEAIELVILHVDVKQKDQRTIQEYEIQNVDAMAVVTTLEELGIISAKTTQQSTARGGTTGRPTSGRQAAAQPGQPELPIGLPTAEGETVVELTAAEPQIAVLESTNSLLVNATPRQHTAIALIIAHVDRELEKISTPFIVYALENQDPDELAGVLNELIQETLEQAQKSAPDAKIQTAGTTALPSKEEERIKIIADTASYSLIVFANKKNQQWVGELIKELDQYRPQVLLDCALVEITHQDDFSYDLNILASIPDLNYTSGVTDNLGTTDNPFPFTRQTILNKLMEAPDRSKFIDFGIRSGDFTGFFGNDKIMALFEAIQTKKYGRILAKPKLLVDDNQKGNIEAKTTTYIERKTITYVQGPESGTQTPVEQVNFEPYDATILLAIKPHISKGDNLRLEVELTRTDFLNLSAAGTKPPNQATSKVNSVVTLPDGSTVILGGLDKVQQEKGGTKVPILGDLPLVGGLFRSTSNTSQQNKLYVFVKANILRPGTDMTSEDLKRISQKYRDEFEEREGEMQRYEDWPGVKPKPMDPRRVLEDDNIHQISEEELLYR